jgi:hypothetical protein
MKNKCITGCPKKKKNEKQACEYTEAELRELSENLSNEAELTADESIARQSKGRIY